MYTGKIIFSQLLEHLPLHIFHKCVDRYHGDSKVKEFTCLDQYLCMAFAQLTYRESLRDIEACLRAQKNKLYHMGIRASVSRNNLANANKVRNWRIYADLAQTLIQTARKMYAGDSFALELENTVYALDATTIDLCLSIFPWAKFRRHKGAIKLHTYSIFGAIFRPSSTSPTANYTMSTSWISCRWRQGHSTLWIEDICPLLG